jgi:hypothetical protein
MKPSTKSQRWLGPLAVSLLLVGSTSMVPAVPDRVLNTFDSGISGWGTAWGNATAAFDPNEDNTGNGGGSVYISADFAADQNTLTVFGNEPPNGAWYFPGPSFNLSDYLSVEFDIKWDTTKTLSIADFNSPPAGGEGGIVIWATDFPGFTIRPTLGNVTVPAGAATGWAHVSLPINPATSGIDPSVGIVFKKWITEAQKNAGGTYGFWVDNVILKGSDAPPPPPTLALNDTTPGLAFVSASGGQWDRQNIRTIGDGYSWVGASAPVSYSVNIAHHSDNEHPGYEFHFFFVPGTPDLGRSDPDWHEPHVLRWDIGNNAAGEGYSSVRYKTNAPDDNGIYYSDGNLGGAGSATPLGTWTIVFNQDTNITTISPSGETNTVILPEDVVPYFSGPMRIYAGSVNNQIANIGQMCVVTRIKIDGTPGAADIDSNFVGQPLDTAIWETSAASSIGVQEIPTDSVYWLTWTLPALGFSLQSSALLDAGWASPTLTGFDAGGKRRILLRQSDLPGADAGYFRLIKREFTKLQILLPGETPAPGTPTGKTGTPDPQSNNQQFVVTVRAVDADWFPVSGVSHIISLSSSAGNDFLYSGEAAMANGVVTFDAAFFTSGSFTITAEDVTDATKTPDTSPAITVN